MEKKALITSVFALSEVAGFFSRKVSPKIASSVVDEIKNFKRLGVIYFEGSHTFQDSLLSTCIATGLSAADAIHYLQALSHPDIDELVTLDRDFKKVEHSIKVTVLE